MPLLTLRFKDRLLQTYPLNIGQTLTIGRSDSNDVVIDNLAVSGNHARIDSVSATFILTDLESTNGTFVNQELISSHGLRHNDSILIGKHTLVFDRSDLDQKKTEQDEDALYDKTRHLDTTEYQTLIRQTTGKDTATSSNVVSRTTHHKSEGFFLRLLKKLFG